MAIYPLGPWPGARRDNPDPTKRDESVSVRGPASTVRLLTAMLAALMAGAVSADQPPDIPPPARFDQGRVSWQKMELGASKFFVSMRATVEVTSRNGDPGPGDVGRMPPDPPLTIRFDTDGLGRRSKVDLVIAPSTGRALRRTSVETGSRHKYRQYVLNDDDILRLTRRPLEGEESGEPAQWSRVSEERIDYPVEPTPVVTEAGALIYLIAASRLREAGDSFEILTLASDEFHQVTATVKGLKPLDVDYHEISGGASKRTSARKKAIRVVLESRLLGDSDGDRFELLGLRNIELFFDPDTRALLQLRGKIDYFGKISFNLTKLWRT